MFHTHPFLFLPLLAQEQQSLIHSTLAESSRTVSERTPGAPRDPGGPGQLLQLLSSLAQLLTMWFTKITAKTI